MSGKRKVQVSRATCTVNLSTDDCCYNSPKYDKNCEHLTGY